MEKVKCRYKVGMGVRVGMSGYKTAAQEAFGAVVNYKARGPGFEFRLYHLLAALLAYLCLAFLICRKIIGFL